MGEEISHHIYPFPDGQGQFEGLAPRDWEGRWRWCGEGMRTGTTSFLNMRRYGARTPKGAAVESLGGSGRSQVDRAGPKMGGKEGKMVFFCVFFHQ